MVGVDIKPQPRYIGDEFYQADALEYLAAHWREYDVVAASPPCQKFSRLNHLHKKYYPDLISPIRDLLISTGKPYIIENVPEASLRNPVTLCGTMFNLLVIRHRAFECNPDIWWPAGPCQHWGKSTPKGFHSTFANGDFITVTGHNFLVNEARLAMGIDWMIANELREAIPPAYTEYIGKQLLAMI